MASLSEEINQCFLPLCLFTSISSLFTLEIGLVILQGILPSPFIKNVTLFYILCIPVLPDRLTQNRHSALLHIPAPPPHPPLPFPGSSLFWPFYLSEKGLNHPWSILLAQLLREQQIRTELLIQLCRMKLCIKDSGLTNIKYFNPQYK